jgi:hypothetical protein
MKPESFRARAKALESKWALYLKYCGVGHESGGDIDVNGALGMNGQTPFASDNQVKKGYGALFSNRWSKRGIGWLDDFQMKPDLSRRY